MALIVLAGQVQAPPKAEIYAQGKRVQIMSTPDFYQALGGAAHRAQVKRIALMSGRLVGIQMESRV